MPSPHRLLGVAGKKRGPAAPGTPPPPPPPPPPAGSLLPYAPPGWNGGDPRLPGSFPGYTQLTINETGPLITGYSSAGAYWYAVLDDNTDYFVHPFRRAMSAGQLQGVNLVGGRNIVMPAGEIQIAHPGTTQSMWNIDQSEGGAHREALVIQGGNPAGRVWCEGIRVYGYPLRGIIHNTNRTVHFVNMRVENVYNLHHSPQWWAHSDLLLSYGGFHANRKAIFYNFTGEYDNTGMAFYDAIYYAGVTLNRVNLRTVKHPATGRAYGGYTIVMPDVRTRYEIGHVYVETGWGTQPVGSQPTSDLPPDTARNTLENRTGNPRWQHLGSPPFTDTQVGNGIGPGSYLEYTAPNTDNIHSLIGGNPRIYYQDDAAINALGGQGGDFCPAGKPGRHYISPRYQT